MADKAPQADESAEKKRKELHEKVINYLSEIGADVIAVPAFSQDGRVTTQVFVIEKKEDESEQTDSDSGSGKDEQAVPEPAK